MDDDWNDDEDGYWLMPLAFGDVVFTSWQLQSAACFATPQKIPLTMLLLFCLWVVLIRSRQAVNAKKHSLLSRTLLPAAVWGILSKIAKKLDNQTSDLLSQRKNEIKVIVWKEIWLSNVFWHLYFFVVSSDRVFNGNNMYL